MVKLAYDVDEAAEMLSLSRWKLYELMRSKRLGSIKVDGRRLIRHSDLEQFLTTAGGQEVA